MDQKLRDKGSELREWHNKKFQSLLWQQEVITMAKEDVASQGVRLAKCEALLNAKEKDISTHEGNLEATLRAKGEERLLSSSTPRIWRTSTKQLLTPSPLIPPPNKRKLSKNLLPHLPPSLTSTNRWPN